VICSSCSKNKFLIPSQSPKPVRVCDTCNNNLVRLRLGRKRPNTGHNDNENVKDSNANVRSNEAKEKSEKIQSNYSAIDNLPEVNKPAENFEESSDTDNESDDVVNILEVEMIQDEKVSTTKASI
jgi:pleckstrin homology domain-containing family F member 2